MARFESPSLFGLFALETICTFGHTGAVKELGFVMHNFGARDEFRQVELLGT
jgi:hypothetical protein